MRPASWRGTTAVHASHPGVRSYSSDLMMGLASPGAFPCPERSPAYNVQFSKRIGDGHYVAFGTEFGQVVILDTRANAVVMRDHNGPVGWGQTDRTRARRSTSGITYPGRGNVGYCRSWGVQQPAVVAQYQALINCIFDVEWTHEDRQMALACGDAKIRVHDTETSIEVLMLHGHGGSVKAISANPVDNSVLLSGSRDGSFALWDTRLRREKPDMEGLHRLTDIERATLTMAPSNQLDTRYLAPVEQVHFANHFDIGQRKRPLSYVKGEEAKIERGASRGGIGQSSVTAVEWMPDGQKLLTAGQDGQVKLWDTRYINQPLQAVGSPSDARSGCHTSPLSPATSNARAPATPCSSLSTPPSQSPSTPRSSPFSPGLGDRRSSSGRGGGGARRGKASRGSRRAAVPFGRVTGGESVAEETLGLGGRPCGVSSVHACDDGSRIAVCTVKDHVSVYAYASGSLRHLGAFTGNQNRSSYYIKAKLSPDGSLLASGATNDALCLWQVDCPGPPVARLTGHLNEVTGVDWCRAEPLKLATSSDDETVRVWTVDPLRVTNLRSAAQRASSSSSSPLPPFASVNAQAPGAEEFPGSGMIGTVLGWTPGLPRPYAGTELGGGSVGAGVGGSRTSGGGSDGGRSFGGDEDYDTHADSRGKFRVGTAVVGESSWWRGRGRGGGAGCAHSCHDGGGDARDDGNRSPPDGATNRPQWHAGRVQSPLQARNGRQDGPGADDMMDVSTSPSRTTPPPTPIATPLTPVVPERRQTRGEAADFGGESLVFSPRSANQKPGVATPTATTSCAKSTSAGGASGDDDGGSTQRHLHGRCEPVAHGEAQPRDDENAAPGLRLKVTDADVGVSSQRAVRVLHPQALDGDLDVIVLDAPGLSSSSRGFLDGLPRGWSTAARAVIGVGPSACRLQKQQDQQHEQPKRQTRKSSQVEETPSRQIGAPQGRGRGAIPPSRESHTLFAFWNREHRGVWNESDARGGMPSGKAEGRS
ncbi:unnamed protein product [Scytosiphon promiscuus]